MEREAAASLCFHEVRVTRSHSVVNFARGLSRRLSRPELDLASAQRVTDQISGEALRAAAVVQRLRAFLRKDAPKKELCDAGEVVREAAHLIDDEARRRRDATGRTESFWMVCPKCGGTLEEIEHRGVKVDRCQSCAGVYLDRGELDLLASTAEASGFFVMRLARTAFAGVTSEGLRPGQWRDLTKDELMALRETWGVPKRIRGQELAAGARGMVQGKIVQRGDLRPSDMIGNWAGELGPTQFTPSDYYKHGVDFDGDGRRDIWKSTGDALASIANYLKGFGWNGDETWGREVKLTTALRSEITRTVPKRTEGCFAIRNMTARRPLAEWQKRGVRLVNGRPLPNATIPAGLVDVGCSARGSGVALTRGRYLAHLAPPASDRVGTLG